MATTETLVPIWHADGDTPVKPDVISMAEANSVAQAFARAGIPSVADLDALKLLEPEALPGDFVKVAEGGGVFVREAAVFSQVQPARFGSSAARDAAYAKGSGSYRNANARVYRTDLKAMQRFFGDDQFGTGKARWVGGPFNLTFPAGLWADFANGDFQKTGGFVDEDGWVDLHGIVKRIGTNLSVQSVCAMVPSDVAPRSKGQFVVATQPGLSKLEIEADGDLAWYPVGAQTQPQNVGFVSLAGVRYSLLAAPGA